MDKTITWYVLSYNEHIKMGWGHLKICSRTTGPKKLKFIFTQTLFGIIKKQSFKIKALEGRIGPLWGNCFYKCIYRKNGFQIFFSRTTGPEWLKFTWKFSDIVQINSGLLNWRFCGATTGETVLKCVHIGKYLKNLFSSQLSRKAEIQNKSLW